MSDFAHQQIPDGYKQTEVGIIPDDWRVACLSEVSEKITDGTHDTPKPVNVGVPFLTAIHVKENKIGFDACYYLPQSVHDEIYRRCNPQRNDVLMVNIGAGVATTALVNVDYEFSLKNVALIKPKKSKLLGAYLNFYQSYVKNKIFESLSSGGAQPFLSLAQIGQLNVSLPKDIKEQNAIANALSDVDALITSIEKLIAKKRAIKTAAMQQLLTGKKRLPPFDKTHTGYKQTELGAIPEDWRVISIGQAITERIILEQMDGNHGELYPKSHEFSDSGIPYVGATDFDNGVVNFKSCKYLPIQRANLFKKGIAKKGDVLFAHNATVGPVALLDTDFEFVILSTTATYYRCNVGFLNNTYLKAYFESEYFIRQYTSVMSQSTRNQVPILAQRKFLLLVPCIKEQSTIANVLSDMDKEIEVLEQRLSKTQQLKQGMMHELLTGSARLVDVT